MSNIPEHYLSSNKVNKLVHKALSDEELKVIQGKDLKIVMRPDLAKYTTIEQLLPNPNDYCIILIVESESNSIFLATGQLYLNMMGCSSILTRTGTTST